MLRSRSVLTAAFVTLLALVFPMAASAWTPTWVPTGVSPGETYHLVFVTSTTQQATSSTIGDYNTIVDDLGDTLEDSPFGDVTWKCIGSTASVDAIDNAPISGPVYLLDGTTKVVDDEADMWDGAVDASIDISETGGSVVAKVWTGTTTPGVGNNMELGDSPSVYYGRSNQTSTAWVASGSAASSIYRHRLYGISEPLTGTGIPEPGTFLLAVLSLAAGGTALRGRRPRSAGAKRAAHRHAPRGPPYRIRGSVVSCQGLNIQHRTFNLQGTETRSRTCLLTAHVSARSSIR